MLHWLFRWFVKPTSDERADVFLPKERQIYEYFDGQKQVKSDPMTIYKKIMAVGPSLDIDMRLASSAHSDAPKGYENSINKLRECFDVLPWEQGGLLEDEVFDLFTHFMEYNNTVKKNSRTLPTPSPLLEDSSAGSAYVPDTKNSTDCGSIASVPPIEPSPPTS